MVITVVVMMMKVKLVVMVAKMVKLVVIMVITLVVKVHYVLPESETSVECYTINVFSYFNCIITHYNNEKNETK